MADMTKSTRGSVAASTRAREPKHNSGHSPRANPELSSLFVRRSRAASVAVTTQGGRNRAICWARTSTFCPATRAWMQYFSGCRPTTSRVLTPMDPVEPRMVSVFNYPIIPVSRISVLDDFSVQFQRSASWDRTNRRVVSYNYLIHREANPLMEDQVPYA